MASVPRHARLLTVKTAKQDPDSVLVSIEDSGTGIDPANVVRIFEAFFTTKSHGMGMGLSICRSIIEAHNGRLWASSDVDRGAAFNILLPRNRTQNLNSDQMLGRERAEFDPSRVLRRGSK